MSKLRSSKKKVENFLRKEKVENKVQQTQIKKLQVELLVADSQTDKGVVAQNLLSEKEHASQLLKNKLKIPST